MNIIASMLFGLATAVILFGCVKLTANPATLEVAVQSPDQIWNAVAHFKNRTYVAGPRWTGGNGPQLTVINVQGHRTAYPDQAWNGWKPGQDARETFVNINALRLEGATLWVVDTGAAEFGGNPLPGGGAKLVAIDLVENRVVRSYPFSAEVAQPGSYIDDVRFQGNHAFLTDAGNAGIIVVDLLSGKSRRVLDGHPSVSAQEGREIVLNGKTVKAPGGAPLRVNADPLEVSPDGMWLYFGALTGPWSKVRIADLVAPALSPEQLADRVEPFADLPPTGGTVMDAKGNLYFSELATNAMHVRRPNGQVDTLIVDERLHWVDAPFLDQDGTLWLPAAQMDRVGLFNAYISGVQWPMTIFRLKTR